MDGGDGIIIDTALGWTFVTGADLNDVEDIIGLRDDLARWMVQRRISQWSPGELPREWPEGCQ